jgi:hypothetical protein
MGQKMPEGEDPQSGGEVDTAVFTALLQQVTNGKSQIRIPALFFVFQLYHPFNIFARFVGFR